MLVVGGGRWAKNILGVLDSFLPTSTDFYVFSVRNALGMTDWVSRHIRNRTVEVTSVLPVAPGSKTMAAIVANSAKDHYPVAAALMARGTKVLVEKPVATTHFDVQRLLAVSRGNGDLLAAAHVFRFAPYLQNFASLCEDKSAVREMLIVWEDPREEIRGGEVKSYDPSIPVFVDVLPHIFAIIASVLNVERVSFSALDVASGGSETRVELKAGRTKVKIILGRNRPSRRRQVEVRKNSGTRIAIDFSLEPGVIRVGSSESIGCSNWSTCRRPLEEMLSIYVNWASGGVWDKRLSPDLAWGYSELSDRLMPYYETKLQIWISRQLMSCRSDPELYDDDMKYALEELSCGVFGGQ